MSAVNVKNSLGEYFTVSGSWVYDGDEASRVIGGTFRVSVLARSAEDAISQAAAMMHHDIVVTGLEMRP